MDFRGRRHQQLRTGPAPVIRNPCSSHEKGPEHSHFPRVLGSLGGIASAKRPPAFSKSTRQAPMVSRPIIAQRQLVFDHGWLLDQDFRSIARLGAQKPERSVMSMNSLIVQYVGCGLWRAKARGSWHCILTGRRLPRLGILEKAIDCEVQYPTLYSTETLYEERSSTVDKYCERRRLAG